MCWKCILSYHLVEKILSLLLCFWISFCKGGDFRLHLVGFSLKIIFSENNWFPYNFWCLASFENIFFACDNYENILLAILFTIQTTDDNTPPPPPPPQSSQCPPLIHPEILFVSLIWLVDSFISSLRSFLSLNHISFDLFQCLFACIWVWEEQ